MLSEELHVAQSGGKRSLQLGRLEGVGLVRIPRLVGVTVGCGDEQQAARGEDADELVQHGERLVDALDDLEAEDQVEPVVLELELAEVARLKSDGLGHAASRHGRAPKSARSTPITSRAPPSASSRLPWPVPQPASRTLRSLAICAAQR